MPIGSLFQPLVFKGLTLKNRIVMAPMTRSHSPHGIPTADVASYYRRRAQNEVGLIITEGTVVERPAAAGDPSVPHFYGDALPAWGEVLRQVHGAGGKIAPQLWHVGAQRDARHPEYQPQPIDSPSGLAAPDVPVGAPMTDSAIADTIGAFATAAAAARQLGFDAVELHGAHGYLMDQFFWAGTNVRMDHWGGASVAERARFGAAVVSAVRAAVGPQMPLILRLSQWKIGNFDVKIGSTPEELQAWLEPLAAAGVDMFHCSQRRYWDPEFPGSDLNFAGWAKKLTGKLSITVGSVGLSGEFIGSFRGEKSHSTGVDELVRRLERGDFDLVAVGRALLGDPAWAKKIRNGNDSTLQVFDPVALATLY